MRRQRKTREREKSLPNLAFSQILRIGQHGGTRPKRRTHPTRVCVFPLTLSFPRYFIFPAWFASSPTQFLILSRSLCARGGKRKGKKDIGKNEKRGRGKRKGAKIKRGCKRKANRKIRPNKSNYSSQLSLLWTNFTSNSIPRWPIETRRWNRPEWFSRFMAETRRHAPFSPLFSRSASFSRLCHSFSQRRTAVSLRATFSNLGRPNFHEILAFGFFEAAPPGRREIEQRWKILIIPPRAFLPPPPPPPQGRDSVTVPDFTGRSITTGSEIRNPSALPLERNATRNKVFAGCPSSARNFSPSKFIQFRRSCSFEGEKEKRKSGGRKNRKSRFRSEEFDIGCLIRLNLPFGFESSHDSRCTNLAFFPSSFHPRLRKRKKIGEKCSHLRWFDRWKGERERELRGNTGTERKEPEVAGTATPVNLPEWAHLSFAMYASPGWKMLALWYRESIFILTTRDRVPSGQNPARKPFFHRSPLDTKRVKPFFFPPSLPYPIIVFERCLIQIRRECICQNYDT